MTKFFLIAALLLLLARDFSRADQAPTQPTNPVINGMVKVADQVKLPAMEAGVLVKLIPKEGTQVKAGEVIGNIDDREPQMKKKAAYADYVAAYKRATDEIEIEFAKAQYDVSVAEVKRLDATNVQAAKAVPETDIEKAKLEVTHFRLAIKKAIHDQELAKYEAATKQAELDGANLSIDRRIVRAPFAGVVEEVKRKQDEWCQPGDTILTLLRLDLMHVEGQVEQKEYDPNEIQGCDVSVEVKLARGRTATVRGKIIKVSNLVAYSGTYNVRAEITNQQDHGTWILRDGMPASMTVHLGTGGNASVSRAR